MWSFCLILSHQSNLQSEEAGVNFFCSEGVAPGANIIVVPVLQTILYVINTELSSARVGS